MAIIPPLFAQVNFRFTGAALPYGAECTIGIYHGDTETPLDVAEQMYAAWSATFLTDQSSSVTLESVLVKKGPNSTGPSAVFGGADAGSESAAAVPPNTCVLVRKFTELGGKTHRGRMYIPGAPEGSINAAGQLESTYFDEVNDSADAFLAALQTADHPAVLLHGASSDPDLISDLTVSSLCATQRQRLRP